MIGWKDCMNLTNCPPDIVPWINFFGNDSRGVTEIF